jgi:hypothetical protein
MQAGRQAAKRVLQAHQQQAEKFCECNSKQLRFTSELNHVGQQLAILAVVLVHYQTRCYAHGHQLLHQQLAGIREHDLQVNKQARILMTRPVRVLQPHVRNAYDVNPTQTTRLHNASGAFAGCAVKLVLLQICNGNEPARRTNVHSICVALIIQPLLQCSIILNLSNTQ